VCLSFKHLKHTILLPDSIQLQEDNWTLLDVSAMTSYGLINEIKGALELHLADDGLVVEAVELIEELKKLLEEVSLTRMICQ
jgi:hypothetical protein